MTYTAEERKFWAEAFLQLHMVPVDKRAARFADEALRVYRERFSSVPESPDSSTAPPDFSGAPEPITDDVLRSLGFEQPDYGPWRICGHAQCAIMFVCANSARVTTDLTDARKLRAIMEILGR